MPTMINQVAKSTDQNVQLIRSLIVPSASKPTILLTHPTASMADTSNKPGPAPSNIRAARPSPVFARIITPTAGLRLAGIRPGQVLTPSQLAAVQNIIQVNQGQLTLDPNQIHQIAAGGAQKQNIELKIESVGEIKNEPK